MWRSAGWPCQDAIEVDLLVAGLLERSVDAQGRETLRLTDLGLRELAAFRHGNRAMRDDHERLVEQVATEMQRAGRIVWRGLALRALVATPDDAQGEARRWAVAMPDVFSIRNTTVEHYVEPVVHEIKVRRADLLGDLRNPAKRAAYIDLSSECWYVLREGIGGADDVPDECGVMLATDAGLQVLRAAPKRAMRLGFGTWMALAKSVPLPVLDDDAQAMI